MPNSHIKFQFFLNLSRKYPSLVLQHNPYVTLLLFQEILKMAKKKYVNERDGMNNIFQYILYETLKNPQASVLSC